MTPTRMRLWFRLTQATVLLLVVAASAIALLPKKLSEEEAIRRDLARVETHWLSLRKAFADYGMDRCGVYFPPDTAERRKDSPGTPLTFELDKDFITSRPVGVDGKPAGAWFPLTSPVSYLDELPRDPFNDDMFYGYTCWNIHDQLPVIAILHSPGPNRRTDLSLPDLRERLEPFLRQCWSERNRIGLEDSHFAHAFGMASPFLYDPTNGLVSDGDLIAYLDCGYDMRGFVEWDDPWRRQRSSATSATLPAGAQFVRIPAAVGRAIALSGVIGSERTGKSDWRYRLMALEPRMGKLGPHFEAFFNAPRPLTEAQQSSLQKWMDEDPDWWNALRPVLNKDSQRVYQPMEIGEWNAVFPIYGKSQLLLAAYDMGLGNSDLASDRLDDLENSLHALDEQTSWTLHPHGRRIHDELLRLSGRLRRHL